MAAFTTSLIIGLIAGGVTTQAVGTVKAGNAARRAGKAQKDAADASAELLDYNASVADVQAQDAIARGQIDENRYRAYARTVQSGQRAGFAGQNVDVSSGSAADVQADTAYLAELDARTIRSNAMREAWGYQVEAYDTRRKADIERREGIILEDAGKAQQTASRIAAAGNILGTAGSLLAMRYGFGQSQPKPTPAFRESDIFAYGAGVP